MATEGDLNKVNGDIFFAGDVTALINIHGKMFKNQAQLIFNADLIGLDANLDEEYENLDRDILSNTSEIDQTNSIIKDIPVFGAEVMDDFQDDSIDGNIWSTGGTVAENGGKIRLTANNGTSNARADQVNAQDFNRVGTVFVSQNWTFSGTSNVFSSIRIIDESANEVTLRSISPGANGATGSENLRFEFDGANNVQVHVNDIQGDGSGTAVDVTSLVDGDEWHIKFRNNSSELSNTFNFFSFVRYLENSAVSKDFISDTTTAGSTITDAIFVVNKDIGGTASVTYFLSADNGANYESVTLNEIHRFSNTGTQLKVKVTMLNDSSDKVFILNHYAIWYNIGAS